MKGDYLGLIDYFSEEELPEFEITVKNILRKSLWAAQITDDVFCMDKNFSLDKFITVFEDERKSIRLTGGTVFNQKGLKSETSNKRENDRYIKS